MHNRNIKVTLTDEEYAYIKWQAKQDHVTISKELEMIFNIQLREDMEIHQGWRVEK